MDKTKKILLLIVSTVFCLSLGILIFQFFHSSPGKTAVIYQNKTLVRRISLSEITEPYVFTITSPLGGYNTISVEEGKIGVTDTDCPDKICENMGMISGTMYPISCLPHKLVIQIQDDKHQELDSISR